MQIGFIGAGQMAQAIVYGIMQAKCLPAKDLFLTSASGVKAQKLALATGANAVSSNYDLVCELEPGSLVFLAVKPHQIEGVLGQIRQVLTDKGHTLVSIAAGITLSQLATLTSHEQPIIRVMPNVNVKVREGMSAVCATATADARVVQATSELFAALGDVVEVSERLFPVFAAVAGASPAWTAKYIDALATAALAEGLPKDIANRVVAQAVAGTAHMLLSQNGDLTPADLIDAVQSPGGTTVAGSIALDRSGFGAAVMNAVDACIKKDASLGK